VVAADGRRVAVEDLRQYVGLVFAHVGQQRAPVDVADRIQPRQAGHGQLRADFDRLPWPQARRLQAQVARPRAAADGDLASRKVTFLTGLAGFAGVSAIGGASVNFAMLVTARACQGAFAALLVPSALSLLTTTFTEPKDRGKAFGIYGAIAGAGGAVGLLLGGALTEYLSWRWTLYVNLLFAGAAFTSGALLLQRQPSRVKPRLDLPGALLVSSALFCLVYGFSNAATHHWATPSTYGFLAAGAFCSTMPRTG
jgi:MFS family permease